jgi:hypothetical protein
MSFFKSAAALSSKSKDAIFSKKDAIFSKKAEIDLVDIGEPLAKIVRENNNKAVQDYWNTQRGNEESLGGFAWF